MIRLLISPSLTSNKRHPPPSPNSNPHPRQLLSMRLRGRHTSVTSTDAPERKCRAVSVRNIFDARARTVVSLLQWRVNRSQSHRRLPRLTSWRRPILHNYNPHRPQPFTMPSHHSHRLPPIHRRMKLVASRFYELHLPPFLASSIAFAPILLLVALLSSFFLIAIVIACAGLDSLCYRYSLQQISNFHMQVVDN